MKHIIAHDLTIINCDTVDNYCTETQTTKPNKGKPTTIFQVVATRLSRHPTQNSLQGLATVLNYPPNKAEAERTMRRIRQFLANPEDTILDLSKP